MVEDVRHMRMWNYIFRVGLHVICASDSASVCQCNGTCRHICISVVSSNL